MEHIAGSLPESQSREELINMNSNNSSKSSSKSDSTKPLVTPSIKEPCIVEIEKNDQSLLKIAQQIEGLVKKSQTENTANYKIKYYSNLSTVSSLLAGFGLRYVEKSKGVGITAFLAVLFLLFVVFWSLTARNLLIRGLSSKEPTVAPSTLIWAIDIAFLLGSLCYFTLMILLCVPWLANFTPAKHENISYSNSFVQAIQDLDHLPHILAYLSFVLIFLFYVLGIYVVRETNNRIDHENAK